METQKPAIAIHGGAGEWPQERRMGGLLGAKRAAESGFEVLKLGGSALDAVENAVMSMEENEVFNAGLGSSLNLDKRVEMEASIMDGKTLSAGAVGLLYDIKHPVRLARIIMENTDHVFIIGGSAEKLAETFGLERRDPKTKLREKYWKELRDKVAQEDLSHLPKLSRLLKSHPNLFSFDTVGAVAVDKDGSLAAATSTGGRSMKIPGRIGDSPLIGCGNYADNEGAACSATGIGEIAVRLVLAKSTCDLVRGGQTPQQATVSSIKEVNRRIGSAFNQMGLVAINSRGEIGAAHNTPHLCWASMTPKTGSPKAFMEAKQVKRTP